MRSTTQGLLAVVLFVHTACAWAGLSAQDQQRLHSQASLLAMDALIYYDTDPRAATLPDASLLHELSETRRRFETASAAGSLPAGLAAPLAGMDADLNALQRLPRDQASRYAPLLISLLDNRERLNRQMDATPTAPAASPLAQALNRQSQRIGEIYLHALARNAVVLREHSMAHHDTGLQPLDQAIEQGFEQLKELMPPGDAAQLQHQRLTYRFVRPKLLQPDALQKSAAAKRYIAGILAWLDRQALGPIEVSTP